MCVCACGLQERTGGMSSSSDSSGPSSSNESEAASADKLARRVLRKLSHAPLHQTMAVADHRKV